MRMVTLAAVLAAVRVPARSQWAVDLGALGGTRTPSLLIRRLCHAFLRPGDMPSGLRECCSLPCVVCQSYAMLCGQNEATGTDHGSEGLRLGRRGTRDDEGQTSWPTGFSRRTQMRSTRSSTRSPTPLPSAPGGWLATGNRLHLVMSLLYGQVAGTAVFTDSGW